MVKPVQLSKGLYGVPEDKKASGNTGNLKSRIVFKQPSSTNSEKAYEVYAKPVSKNQRTKQHPPVIFDPITKFRFVPLRVKEGNQKSAWVLVNYGSLKKLGITKSEAKAAYKNSELEKLVAKKAKVVKPVAISEGLYGVHGFKKASGLTGKLKKRIVFKKLASRDDSAQNIYRIYAKPVSQKNRTFNHAPIITNPLTKYRFLPLRVKEGQQQSTWVLVNYGSLKRLGITKAEAKAAFQKNQLEHLVRKKIHQAVKENKPPSKKAMPKNAKPIEEGVLKSEKPKPAKKVRFEGVADTEPSGRLLRRKK